MNIEKLKQFIMDEFNNEFPLLEFNNFQVLEDVSLQIYHTTTTFYIPNDTKLYTVKVSFKGNTIISEYPTYIRAFISVKIREKITKVKPSDLQRILRIL